MLVWQPPPRNHLFRCWGGILTSVFQRPHPGNASADLALAAAGLSCSFPLPWLYLPSARRFPAAQIEKSKGSLPGRLVWGESADLSFRTSGTASTTWLTWSKNRFRKEGRSKPRGFRVSAQSSSSRVQQRNPYRRALTSKRLLRQAHYLFARKYVANRSISSNHLLLCVLIRRYPRLSSRPQ